MFMADEFNNFKSAILLPVTSISIVARGARKPRKVAGEEFDVTNWPVTVTVLFTVLSLVSINAALFWKTPISIPSTLNETVVTVFDVRLPVIFSAAILHFTVVTLENERGAVLLPTVKLT